MILIAAMLAAVPARCETTRFADLAAVKVAAARRDPAIAPAYDALIADARAALAARAPAVTDKPAGESDRHFYRSTGPYWWPDPARPDGLPWIRRDGQINPAVDSDAFDNHRLDKMRNAVEVLTLAYHFTGDRRYAVGAARYLRTWFLAPATRMLPDFSFAQGVPGRSTGRPFGLIEARAFASLIDAIGLLRPSGALSAADLAGLRRWNGDFARWMMNSTLGREEDATDNNHALYYDAILARLSLFAGDAATARRVAAAFVERRVATQVAADGRLPEEMARTRSMSYSGFAVNAMLDMAQASACVGVDVTIAAANGRSIRQAVDFLAEQSPATWPGAQIHGAETDQVHRALVRAARLWRDPRYLRAAENYPIPADARFRLLAALPG